MDLPCETIGRYVIPVLRSYIAKQLIWKHNFTQVEVAESLGTTQAAVSQYIHLKRGDKAATKLKKSLSTIETAAINMARKIATKKIGQEQIMKDLCKTCRLLYEKGRPMLKEDSSV